jgi:CarboxypepD_reg-like domain
MTKYFCLLLLYFCCFQSLLRAQTLNAVVLESQTKTPIPYASVYIPNKIGINCNENGQFQLNLDKTLPNDTITISCVGYKTLRLP